MNAQEILIGIAGIIGAIMLLAMSQVLLYAAIILIVLAGAFFVFKLMFMGGSNESVDEMASGSRRHPDADL